MRTLDTDENPRGRQQQHSSTRGLQLTSSSRGSSSYLSIPRIEGADCSGRGSQAIGAWTVYQWICPSESKNPTKMSTIEDPSQISPIGWGSYSAFGHENYERSQSFRPNFCKPSWQSTRATVRKVKDCTITCISRRPDIIIATNGSKLAMKYSSHRWTGQPCCHPSSHQYRAQGLCSTPPKIPKV